MPDHSTNLRRLMAQFGLTIDQVAERSGLDQRTVRGVLRGTVTPHARTLRKLTARLGVSTDELFLEPSLLLQRNLDRAANPLVDEVLAEYPHLVEGWGEADFEELCSRVGAGGGLTREEALDAIRLTNRTREVLRKVEVLMETEEAELVEGIVEILYRKAGQDGR
jgi:transcriptional regulator with XRE-family HTH domain